MRGPIALALLGLGTGIAAASPVSGRVVDGHGQPIAGATVTIEGAAKGVATDDAGAFTIVEAPDGASLFVMKDGFGAGLATAGQAEDIVLLADDPRAAAAETIEVHDTVGPSTQGAVKLTREELQRLPGTGNDIVRSLQVMPGVASYPLPIGASGVVIRGSSPQDSKVLIDEFEVPSLYHDIGFRSVVPAEAIESLEYTPGGFDVSSGRATSGVVNLTTRPGGANKQQFEGGASELGTLVQGTSGKLRYLIAFRRSMVDLLLPALMPDGLDLSFSTVPRYYDEQLRLDYELSPKWNLRVSSLGSDDALELYASKDRNPGKRLFNRTRFVRLTAAARYHDGDWTGNLAVSGMALQTTFERGTEQHLDVVSPSIATRGELARSFGDTIVKLGGENVITEHRIDLAMPAERREGEPLLPDDPMNTANRYAGTVTTKNLATWTHISTALDERVRVTGGVRIDSYRRSGDTAIQPRGDVAIKLSKKLTAKLSAGVYSRPPEHQTELLASGLRAERSTQVIGGTTYEPATGIRIQSSLYYTDRRRLITSVGAAPTSNTADGRVDDMLTNRGTGTTYGAELLGQVNRGPFLGWLSYGYSHSTRVDEPGAERRLFDYDQPHNLNVAGSYKVGKWTFGARFRLSSGLPTTPVATSVFDSDANIHYPSFGDVNSERAPMHHQLDIRIDKTWKWGPVKMSKFLDVQNVYLNDTVVTYYYGFDYTQRAAFRTLPILPTAGLRGEF